MENKKFNVYYVIVIPNYYIKHIIKNLNKEEYNTIRQEC